MGGEISTTLDTLPIESTLEGRVLPFQGAISEAWRFVVAALLIPLLPTLLWFWQSHSWLYLRGWIDMDYMLLLGIAFLYPSRAMIGVLTAEMCIALLEPIAHLFYFSPSSALLSLRYLQYIPLQRLMVYAVVVFAYTLVSAAVLRVILGTHRRKSAQKMVVALVVCGMIGVTTDLFRGRLNQFSLGLQLGTVDVREKRIVRAPGASLLQSIYIETRHANIPSHPIDSTLSRTIAGFPDGSKPNIVLVLTESWGQANDDRINQAQIDPYRNPAISSLYRVQTGDAPFVGGTTSGETRELCGDSWGFSSINGPDSFFTRCWPSLLNRAGYRTLAVHGFTPGMFKRGDWYRRFGFQNSAFMPELLHDGATMCDGAFPGICDADVATWIGNRLQTDRDGKPTFIHWVTLNSHIPVPPLEEILSPKQCAVVGIEQQESLCSWFMRVLRVQESVARLALTPGLRPTVFVIVGDHAPPFLRVDTRNQFSPTRVPFVVLIPRSIKLQPQASEQPLMADISSSK